MTKEYVVVALLDSAKETERILHWPLHITILPWFSFHDYEGFCQKAKDVIQIKSAFYVRVGHERLWGQRSVNVLEYSSPLHQINEELLKIAEKHGCMQTHGNHYVERGYVPHITHQGKQSVEVGRRINVDNLYLVERDMSHHTNSIAEIFKLAK